MLHYRLLNQIFKLGLLKVKIHCKKGKERNEERQKFVAWYQQTVVSTAFIYATEEGHKG